MKLIAASASTPFRRIAARPYISSVFYGLVIVASQSLQASGVKFQPSIRANTTSSWTSNDENENESVNVTSITPKLEFGVSAKRAVAKLNLGAKHSIFSDTREATTVPALTLEARFNAFQENYIVDTKASVTQRSIDDENTTQDSLGGSFDDEITSNFGIRQSYRNRISSNSLMHFGQTFATTKSTLESDIGSESYIVDAEYVSALSSKGLNLKLNAEYQGTFFDNSETGSESKLQSFIIWPYTKSITLFAGIGHDWITFADSENSAESMQNSNAWLLGMSWIPRKNITTRFAYAERFYGSSPRASIAYSARRSGIELSWNRKLRSSRTREFVAQADDLGSFETFTEPSGLTSDSAQPGDSSLSPLFDDQRNIDERVSVDMYFNTAKTTFTSSFSYLGTEIYNEETNSSTKNSLLYQIGASRRFGQRISASLTASLSDTTNASNNDTDSSEDRTSSIAASVFWSY